MKELSNFPMSRYKHCYSVGKQMYEQAKKMGYDENFCRDMFVLGNIHDIGYELDGSVEGHGTVLSECLKDSYKYSKELRYHSDFQKEYDSIPMRLLYFGDMTVDGQGNRCTFEERLKDIAIRHGENTEEYRVSKDLALYLRELGFDDSI